MPWLPHCSLSPHTLSLQPLGSLPPSLFLVPATSCSLLSFRFWPWFSWAHFLHLRSPPLSAKVALWRPTLPELPPSAQWVPSQGWPQPLCRLLLHRPLLSSQPKRCRGSSSRLQTWPFSQSSGSVFSPPPLPFLGFVPTPLLWSPLPLWVLLLQGDLAHRLSVWVALEVLLFVLLLAPTFRLALWVQPSYPVVTAFVLSVCWGAVNYWFSLEPKWLRPFGDGQIPQSYNQVICQGI